MLEVTQGSIIIDFQKQDNNKEVGVICECDIVFSDRANQIVFQEELDKEYPEENSPKKSLQLTNSKYRIPLLELSPNLAHQASISESCGLYSLFQIRNFTYVEIRDCNLTSKNKQGVLDAAFVMNEKEYYDSYKGILSVKSCKIQNFSLGFMAGPNSILSIELSYITDCRSSAFICNNPKLFKLSGTVIENVECRGVDLCFRNQNSIQQANSLLSPKAQKENIRKVSIEDNKIQNCKESAIIIHGSALSLNDPNYNTQEKSQLIIKLYKNRIYFNKETGILLKKLHVISIEVHNCDLFGNEQNGILLNRVLQRRAEDIVVTKCRFSESLVGVIAKDSCFLTISECEFVKNKKIGLLVVDTSS